jgi:hypothetical protein
MSFASDLLPCPACRATTRAPVVVEDIEMVPCGGCGKLLQRRRALTPEQRAHALALRWPAAQLESDPFVREAGPNAFARWKRR